MTKNQLSIFKQCIDDLCTMRDKRVWTVLNPKLLHERVKSVFERLEKIGIRSGEMIKALASIKEGNLDVGYQYLFVTSNPNFRMKEAYDKHIAKPEGDSAFGNLVAKFRIEMKSPWSVRRPGTV